MKQQLMESFIYRLVQRELALVDHVATLETQLQTFIQVCNYIITIIDILRRN